jgi:bifunctional ADP-heptose synthase (sugar kinase/adenylyltransferase)
MRILVIGESCKDIFVYGLVNRLCPEAPVPVFSPLEQLENGGMAMNVKNNIQAMGAQVDIQTNNNWETITKTRFIDKRTNHMVMRLDNNDNTISKTKYLDSIKYEKYSAIIISDYNKGFLSEKDILKISTNHDCTFLDTKKILGDWCRNVKFIKINNYEYEKTKDQISAELEAKMIVTLGPNGCRHHGITYPVKKTEIKDVAGAGDTFVAALAFKYVETEDMEKSIVFANESATRVVQKRGVSTV